MTEINDCKYCGWIKNESEVLEWAPNNWYCTNPDCYLNQFLDYDNYEPNKFNKKRAPKIYLCINN